MTPVESQPRLSGWALRRKLAERGHDATQRQLDQFVEWGLLEKTQGRFGGDSVERALDVFEAEAQARSLPRRVLVLRSDAVRWTFAPTQLRRALLSLAPTIRRPIRKMRLVERAWARMTAQLGRTLMSPARRLPPASEWPARLEAIDPTVLEARISGWYAWARDILPAYAREIGADLSEVPLEERVLMVAILDSERPGSP